MFQTPTNQQSYWGPSGFEVTPKPQPEDKNDSQGNVSDSSSDSESESDSDSEIGQDQVRKERHNGEDEGWAGDEDSGDQTTLSPLIDQPEPFVGG
eukprot:SAG31_NODE_20905_length_562_cov_2.053996_2_plen_95_part_00